MNRSFMAELTTLSIFRTLRMNFTMRRYKEILMKRHHTILDQETLISAVHILTAKDPYLSEVVENYGPPPLWAREEGFPTLIRIILEQQVSLQSAKSAYDKLQNTCDKITPEIFLFLSDQELKQVGFSRQKTRYGRELARAICDGSLDLDALREASDKEVIARLTHIKGIGIWTSNIYLLMALKRPDAWPAGDLALELAVQRLMGKKQKPTSQAMLRISAKWRPWRAVAARILYHYYLSTPGTGKKMNQAT